MEAHQRILVVCEDSGTLDRVGKHLCENNYEVRCTASADEALACYVDWWAELVVADYGLTHVPGLELVEQIRKINPKVRFILITPPGETPEFMKATRSRIVAFLGKPFDPEDLMHYVRGAFNLGDSQYNRREHNRYPFSVETHCVLINPFDNSQSRPLAALMRDISRSGVAVIVRQLLPVPAMIKVIFHLPHEQRTVHMLAKSVSCTLTQIPGVYRLGARFVGLLPAELEQTIAEFSRDSTGRRQQDISMGKTFKEAVQDWLAQHRHGLVDDSEGMLQNVERLADELSRDPDDTLGGPLGLPGSSN